MAQAGFSIGFDGEVDHDGLARGRLVLGEFSEWFEASVLTWRRSEYERHWRDAVATIVEGGDRAALVTSLHDPSTANFIRWWPMYRVGGSVVVQEQLLLLADLSEPFNLRNPFRSVPDRSADDEVSKWTVPLVALATWLKLG